MTNAIAAPSVRVWLPSRAFFLVFLSIHAAVSVALLAYDFQLGMARFDSGTSAPAFERIVSLVSTALVAPVFTAAVHSPTVGALFPGRLGWVALLANSALWAVVCWWLVKAVRGLRSAQGPKAQPSS